MKYLSVCSGIEAATQAWHPIGWQPVAFSEIDKFPAAVLAHHYPDVPNWGDMTKFKEWRNATIDVLVGGTPCQSFSVAGLRKGLADPRGNLALTYLKIAERYRPEWLVWENVPGAFSATSHDSPDPCPPPPPVDMECDGAEVETEDDYDSEELHAFNCFLAGLQELGYGFAYRALDAQYVRTRGFPGAVPQRRRRVFVVAHLGDWRRAAAVLFDPESLSGNPPPGRETGQAAPTIPSRSTAGGGLGTDFDCDGGTIPETAHSLTRRYDSSEDGCGRGTPIVPEVCGTLNHSGGHAVPGNSAQAWNAGMLVPSVANPLTHRMHKGINTTCDEGQTPIPISFGAQMSVPQVDVGVNQTLQAKNPMAVAYGFKRGQGDKAGSLGYDREVCPTLTGVESGTQNPPGIHAGVAVRRLTPIECERLQGFPDNFTRIPWGNKPADKCPDGPRYKALGNSMAVNVMSWIGQRIQMVSEMEDAA